MCECCPTTAVATSDGLLTAFRDRSDDEVRDIAVSRLENGKWTTASPVAADNWKLDFCPVNGPMLAARGRDVVATWFTVKNDQGQAYAAFSNDAGDLGYADSPGRRRITWADRRGDARRRIGGGFVGRYAEGRSDFKIRRIESVKARSRPRWPSHPSPAVRRAATLESHGSATS